MFKIYRNLLPFGQKENFGKANEFCQNYHVLEVCYAELKTTWPLMIEQYFLFSLTFPENKQSSEQKLKLKYDNKCN